MCCEARWKREVVPDHKFDYIDLREYHLTDWFTRVRYVFVYILMIKSFGVLCLDLFTGITYVSSTTWHNTLYTACGDDCVVTVKFAIAKWVFAGCILFSFLLLGWDSYKARKIIKSRDISSAFTNPLTNDTLSIRNYDCFCFFTLVSNSTKKMDDLVLFIFFTMKEWKRLIIADGPRQSINALTLYSFAYANDFQTHDIPAYWNGSIITLLLLLSMISTLLIWVGSMILLLAAMVAYPFALCFVIQGNVKEYVCTKVDKRIAELIRRKNRQRLKRTAQLEKELAGRGPVRDKNGNIIKSSMPLQPTIPVVNFDDEDELLGREGKGRYRPAFKAQNSDLGVTFDGSYPPGNGADAGYPPYRAPPPPFTDDMLGFNSYGSQTNLTSAAAPLGTSHSMQRSDTQDSYLYDHYSNDSHAQNVNMNANPNPNDYSYPYSYPQESPYDAPHYPTSHEQHYYGQQERFIPPTREVEHDGLAYDEPVVDRRQPGGHGRY